MPGNHGGPAARWWLLLRSEHHRELLEEPFPPEWPLLGGERAAVRRLLRGPGDLRDALRIFIAEKNWEGCCGTCRHRRNDGHDRAPCTAPLTLGWEDGYLDEPKTVLIYPGSYLAPVRYQESGLRVQARRGPPPRSGRPLLVARLWHSRQPGRSNLVLHEFAHKLAEGGDWTTGMPLLEDAQLRERWESVVALSGDSAGRSGEYGRPTLLDFRQRHEPNGVLRRSDGKLLPSAGGRSHMRPGARIAAGGVLRPGPGGWEAACRR